MVDKEGREERLDMEGEGVGERIYIVGREVDHVREHEEARDEVVVDGRPGGGAS